MVPAEALPKDRYHRQVILPQIGEAGQHRIGAAHAVIIGCGALGSVAAELLARAGVGTLTLIDRDVVEWTNLQRQSLYDEQDAREGLPKAEAARRRLSAINSAVNIRAVVADFSARSAERLLDSASAATVIIDGTDNFETRYLMNDLAVSLATPWVYGGAVATVGRVMTIVPGITACLRCLFEEPPAAGSESAGRTCDVAGVLGPATVIVGALQAAAALRLIVGGGAPSGFLSLDAWEPTMKTIGNVDARREDCPCCSRREFTFLRGEFATSAVSLCGRNAVQVAPARPGTIDLKALAARLSAAGSFETSRYLLRGTLRIEGETKDPDLSLTVFPDGRAVVGGTSDPTRARAIYSKYVGL